MKVLFLQNNFFGNYAIMLLSAVLKKAGHQCDLLIDAFEENIVEKTLKLNPDIIAFSITSPEREWMVKRGREIRKKFKKLIICGGPHPTYYPEAIRESFLDVICVGEGEAAIIDLVNALEENKDMTRIQNLIVKKGEKIYKNAIRPLIQDLDSNPFPDRTIYDRYSFFKNSKNDYFCRTAIQTSRGCPYTCTFCLTPLYNRLCKGKGKIIRTRTVANVIEEMKKKKKKYPKLNFFNIDDEAFTLHSRAWLNEFFRRYKKEINTPFMIQTRPDLLDKDLIKQLRAANCYSIKIGIESGNEYIRNKIFKKGITLQQILSTAVLIKKSGLKLQINNILGAPGETLETALETFELNRKIHPTFAMCY
ncbi:MAG: B12-binding domain-containing radical SAM protein, partial [Candidatus Helarchaeota archaeon]